jgi:malonate decarboxylase gamma subunit
VTKLPIETLTELAKTTPIFAPGLEPLFATGAVTEKWEVATLQSQSQDALTRRADAATDRRDVIGLERKGRLQAHDIALKVIAEAAAYA